MIGSLTIVRHGDTFAPGEPPRRIGAPTDLPLAPSGEAQARALGEAFARDRLRFDRALAGPLERTRSTAALILDRLTTPPRLELRDWLAEIDHGPDEDQPEARVIARVGAEALARWNRSLAAPPGWVIDEPARLAGWRDLLAVATGNALVVTSNGAARFVFRADESLARQSQALPSLKLRTGAWGRIVRETGGWRLAAWDVRA